MVQSWNSNVLCISMSAVYNTPLSVFYSETALSQWDHITPQTCVIISYIKKVIFQVKDRLDILMIVEV